MLSKLVMPLFGPFHPSEHTPSAHVLAPLLFKLHGTSLPPSSTICPIVNYTYSSNLNLFIFDFDWFADGTNKTVHQHDNYVSIFITYKDFQGHSMCYALHHCKIPNQL